MVEENRQKRRMWPKTTGEAVNKTNDGNPAVAGSSPAGGAKTLTLNLYIKLKTKVHKISYQKVNF